MKIGSWNVRGFGADRKKSMVKEIIRTEKLDLIGLVETKHTEVTQWEMAKCWGKVEFDYSHVMATQNSGGIIVTWNHEAFTVGNSFASSRWLCLVGIFQQLKISCALCVVYAPTDHNERMKTWDQLRYMKAIVGVPCIIMGDFNEVMEPSERKGAAGYTTGMRELQNLLLDLDAVDMNIGQNFTWYRKNAASRLDRFWIDKELLLKISSGSVHCKGRMFSDHHPLIFSSDQVEWGPSPFRTLDCWLEEPSFQKTFSLEWIQLAGLPLQEKLKLIKGPLKSWNKKVFGHIDNRISTFQAAIKVLEDKAQEGFLQESDNCRLEALSSQLWLWIARKERYWRQLSRSKLIKEGDRNTKFFHLKASMRKQRNKIDRLWCQGEEINNMKQIEEEIISHFKRLYTKQEGTTFDIESLGLQKLSQDEKERLEQQVSRKEIDDALSRCDSSKAPGYDGFNLRCIKKMWPVIGEDFYLYI